MSTKSDFIRSLQGENKSLSPFDISQRLRLAHGRVSTCIFDNELPADLYGGYMVRFKEKTDRSPENPELYCCVISTGQSKAKQDTVWIKEILQVLDSADQHTNSPDTLDQMLANRRTDSPNGPNTPPNVVADKAGLILALGSAVPREYRSILRSQNLLTRFTVVELESIIGIPQEYVKFVLDPQFEMLFELALNPDIS